MPTGSTGGFPSGTGGGALVGGGVLASLPFFRGGESFGGVEVGEVLAVVVEAVVEAVELLAGEGENTGMDRWAASLSRVRGEIVA